MKKALEKSKIIKLKSQIIEHVQAINRPLINADLSTYSIKRLLANCHPMNRAAFMRQLKNYGCTYTDQQITFEEQKVQ